VKREQRNGEGVTSRRRAAWGQAVSIAIALITTISFAQINVPQTIDLATALRLAGAQSLDVKLAGERLREAQANHDQARMKFFPWIAPGIGFKKHEGSIQDVQGNIIDASKQSYSLGASLTANLDLGQARYESLAAKQLVNAARESVEVRKQDAAFAAASGYFDLLRAQGSIGAARDAVRIAESFAEQVRRAVSAGIAFAGDTARAEVQVEKNKLLLRQAEEFRVVASARLAQSLRLPPNIELAATDAELAPMSLSDTNATIDSLISQAIAERPELRQFAAQHAAAVESARGEKEGRAIPTITASAFAGGLGGGTGGDFGNFGESSDIAIGLGWRFGPGGFCDKGRIAAAESRERSSVIAQEKTRDEVVLNVVESRAHAQSLADQLETSRRALEAAERLHKFSIDRKEFGIGAVMEAVQSEQELTRARLDYLSLIAEHNKAQFALRHATGEAISKSP
jgi:outer membrane protein TolC